MKTNSETLNLAVVTDEFDDEMFDENVDTEAHIEEDDEAGISKSDEENVQPLVDTTLDAPVGTEGNEQNDLTSSRIDWSSYYSKEELRALKVKLINLQDYPNNKDISHIESAVCDSAIVNDEGNPRVGEEVIKTGQLFETLDDVKFFFQDYVVCHHRPYYVAKSTKDIWYIMRCQISSYGWVCGYRWMDHGRGYCSCSWRRVEGVMGEAISYLWYVRSSTCALSMHDKYLGGQIVPIMWLTPI
jgi:hypothetical protein